MSEAVAAQAPTMIALSEEEKAYIQDSGLAQCITELSTALLCHKPLQFRQYMIDWLRAREEAKKK